MSEQNTNQIEITKVCERCNGEYIGDVDERICEECRFVRCTGGCGEWVIRYETCSHGVDGFNNCECECGECNCGCKTDNEEEEEEDEDPHEQCGRCGNPATSGLINDEFICIECRDNEE